MVAECIAKGICRDTSPSAPLPVIFQIPLGKGGGSMLPHLELDGLSWGSDGAPKQGIRYTAVFASLPGMLRPRHQDNGLPGGHEGGGAKSDKP